jgi:hypothetical protein
MGLLGRGREQFVDIDAFESIGGVAVRGVPGWPADSSKFQAIAGVENDDQWLHVL